MSHTARILIATSALLLGAGSCASLASAHIDPPALKGPEVKDRKVPGVEPDFGVTPDGRRRFADRMPPEVFRKALGVLTAPDASTEIRATDEQRERFKKLVDGFEGEAREYRRSHAKELAELRKAAGEAGPGRRPGAGARDKDKDEMMQQDDKMSPESDKKQEEARAKLRELMDGAPKIESIYTKVWADLSEPQRKAVDAELEKFRTEQSQKREDEYVKRRVKERAAQPVDGASGKPTTGGPVRPAVANERRQRLLKLIEEMTPEEQEQLLSRLEQRKRVAPNDKPGERPKRRQNEKPAPDPDDVKVPAPEDKK